MHPLSDHPGEVHFAFRDLASATEDKLTKINNAYIYAQTTTHSANGRATAMTEGAAAAGDSATADANGEAHAFELLAASHGKYEKAMEKKISTPSGVRCKHAPCEFIIYLNYCRGLLVESLLFRES